MEYTNDSEKDMENLEKQKCAFCDEEISGKARKCYHCGEFVNESEDKIKELTIRLQLLNTEINTYTNKSMLQWQSQALQVQILITESTIPTNENIIATNKILKKIFGWTLVVACIGFVLSAINTFESFHKDTLSRQLEQSNKKLQLDNSEILRLKNLENQNHKTIDSLKNALNSAL